MHVHVCRDERAPCAVSQDGPSVGHTAKGEKEQESEAKVAQNESQVPEIMLWTERGLFSPSRPERLCVSCTAGCLSSLASWFSVKRMRPKNQTFGGAEEMHKDSQRMTDDGLSLPPRLQLFSE